MGFLLGLPLRLLGLIFGLIRLWRKYGGHRPSDEAKKDEPHFKGPVYTVDYEEVKDDDKHKE